LGWIAAAGLAARLSAAEPTAAGIEFFERKVRPLLAESCYTCHGEEKQKNHLRLDSTAAIRAGGESGPVIVPEHPEKSRLVIAVGYQDEDLKMPPKKRLSARQIADLTEWVKMGAPMPAEETAAALISAKKEFQITDKDRAHWAFQALKKPAAPAVRQKKWAVNPIDDFILAKLEADGFAPNPPATRRELARRAYYDLTGLPPSPAEVESFLADTSPRAWEQLIDRLLESPRYGEKWGRHWLDLVRFAESNSYERDGDKPNAWRYRDYVIRAFNSDKSYDRFLREQLAGDEFANPDADAIIATGFYRLGIWDDEPADRELARYDGLDDIVATTGQVFLGLTVDCARCHNHKIDPIPQKDYYRLLSFFQNVQHFRNGGPTDEVPLFASDSEKAAHEQEMRDCQKKRDELQAALTQTENLFRFDQMPDVTPRKVRAGVTRAIFLDRPFLESEFGILQVECTSRGKSSAITGQARRQHAIKQVDPARDHLEQLRRRAQAHCVTWFPLRQEWLARFDGMHHFFLRFAHTHSADGISIKIKIDNRLGRFSPEIRKRCALNNTKKLALNHEFRISNFFRARSHSRDELRISIRHRAVMLLDR